MKFQTLCSWNDSAEVSGHGDELGYIFGRNTIFGDRLTDADAEPVEPEAKNVIEAFTEIIANFAHHGEISVSERKLADGILSKIPTFGGSDTTKANPYVSVTTKLTPMNNFRLTNCYKKLDQNID